MAPGRILLAIALLGFGIENILFGRYIVARVAPWPADPSVRFAVACLTGAVFLVHVPLVFRVGRAEWMGVFEALGISGACLALATARAPVPRTVGTPAPIS